ncbi:MAG: hypothetical protein AABZ45_04925 [Pseudomonadota bacterium]
MMARAVMSLLILMAMSAAAQAQGVILDDFDDVTAWSAAASDGVESSADAIVTDTGRGLRFNFDFQRGSGYAFVSRTLPQTWPDNFEVRLRLRGHLPPNALEIKLVDASGDNVWWYREADRHFSGDWEEVRFRRRHVGFAWGPASDQRLSTTARVEIVVVAGSGGSGTIELDRLTLIPLSVSSAVPPVPIRHDDGRAVTLDLGYQREFGGLRIDWETGVGARDYTVALSNDGARWRDVYRVAAGNGGSDWISLRESEARYVRLMRGADSAGARVSEIAVQPIAFGATPNAMISAMAAVSARGRFPRGFYNEQSYWTLLGSDGGTSSGLISEDGQVELAPGGVTIEPFILDDAGHVTSWADVTSRQSLAEGSLPIVSVDWNGPGWGLTITGFAERIGAGERLFVRYALSNRGAVPIRRSLLLGVRPFQVNPPQQFLTIAGGVSAIGSLSRHGNSLIVNGELRIAPIEAADAITLASFDVGETMGGMQEGRVEAITDSTGLASGAFLYTFDLAPGETRSIHFITPLNAAGEAEPAISSAVAFNQAHARVATEWREKLGRVTIALPPSAPDLALTIRASLAHMLMSASGPALRPGTRSYARSWIRDGAMMSEALLRLGHGDRARDYLYWYALNQYDDGKVPCCVDPRGPDPVPENDSQGELIYLASEIYRYTGDRALLAVHWAHIEAAARYIEGQRQSTRVEANRVGARAPLFGLVPPSISHEGYSARPAYSYWDNFWARRGLADAAFAARVLGHGADAERLTSAERDYRGDILHSIEAAARVHGIDFIAGAADLGDFDATSTTIALSPGGMQQDLPPTLLQATFDRYWANFVARRDGALNWDAYTPYEWRTVGALVRLGQPERALAVMDYFMADRRPAAWRQWGEVVSRVPREARFIGDMPHGWVASDFIRSALDMLAYYDEAGDRMVIGAGIAPEWLDGDGVRVTGLFTPRGRLDFWLRRVRGRIRATWRIDAGRCAASPSPLTILFVGYTFQNMRHGSVCGAEQSAELVPLVTAP